MKYIVSERALATIEWECRKSPDTETGGILVGFRHSADSEGEQRVIITHATGPGPRSQRSAVHFVKPAQKVPLEGIDPLAGIFHLIHTFDRFLDPIALLPGLTGLFTLGLVLSYAFMRSGSLYLSIGLHAGWIFSIKTLRVFGDFRREDLGWPFGFSDPKIISGWVTWICLIGVGVAVYYLTRKRQGLQKKT